MKRRNYSVLSAAVLCVLCFGTVSVSPQSSGKALRETVYVPVYSSIMHSDLKWEFMLSVTLSIHNVDINNAIIIESIDYYNTTGKLIHSYIGREKKVLQPLETYNIGIKEADNRGGVGANFIVRWRSQVKVNRPIVETIMIGTKGQQGLSFTSRGVVIEE
ncbi:MAG: hypothetical protein CVV44_02855 [Spirochaetae bacterium HGW-Spirochaetae-1]|jgi:hypothetical protein|nr:MAG: hypothetical protein CVV44_02855 [Spirochaetae bacterium HGW-Spirochaetae-1]